MELLATENSAQNYSDLKLEAASLLNNLPTQSNLLIAYVKNWLQEVLVV